MAFLDRAARRQCVPTANRGLPCRARGVKDPAACRSDRLRHRYRLILGESRRALGTSIPFCSWRSRFALWSHITLQPGPTGWALVAFVSLRPLRPADVPIQGRLLGFAGLGGFEDAQLTVFVDAGVNHARRCGVGCGRAPPKKVLSRQTMRTMEVLVRFTMYSFL